MVGRLALRAGLLEPCHPRRQMVHFGDELIDASAKAQEGALHLLVGVASQVGQGPAQLAVLHDHRERLVALSQYRKCVL